MADAATSIDSSNDGSSPSSFNNGPSKEAIAALRRVLELKTSHDWYHDPSLGPLGDHPVIHNTDGWRDIRGTGAVQAKYWYHVPITRQEFLDRLGQCTMRRFQDGETLATMPDPYDQPYGDEHLEYILRLCAVMQLECQETCAKLDKCRGYHEGAVEEYCQQDETCDEWDVAVANAIKDVVV